MRRASSRTRIRQQCPVSGVSTSLSSAWPRPSAPLHAPGALPPAPTPGRRPSHPLVACSRHIHSGSEAALLVSDYSKTCCVSCTTKRCNV